MKIHHLKIKNFKKIDFLEIDLAGKNVYAIGPNQAGKSSFIDACFSNLPERPLQDNTHKGEIQLEVKDEPGNGYIVQYTFSERNQKPKLTITSLSGEVQQAPATLFNKLFGVTDFNIEEFLNLSDAKQVEKIKELTGIDWEDVDKEYKSLYEERTFLNRKLKELEAKTSGQIANINIAQEIDISELQKELLSANKYNQNISKVAEGIKDREDKIRKNSVVIEKMLDEIESLKKKITDLNLEIDEIKSQNLHLAEDIQSGLSWLQGHKEKNISEIEERINFAIQNNIKFQKNASIIEARNEERSLWGKIKDIEARMQEIKEVKVRSIANAKMPVEGLGFSEDHLTLDGLPFKSNQINTARKIIAGLELHYHFMKDVKIARFEGSLLDKNSMEKVLEWADKNNVQLFIEMVDRDGDQLQIKVEEE